MVGYKGIKARISTRANISKTDPTKLCLVLTVFYQIKIRCCEHSLDSEQSAHEHT